LNVEFINEFKDDTPMPAANPVVFPLPLPLPLAAVEVPQIHEVTADERRAAIRESWLKRFDTT
jgi:hypothetical protein